MTENKIVNIIYNITVKEEKIKKIKNKQKYARKLKILQLRHKNAYFFKNNSF